MTATHTRTSYTGVAGRGGWSSVTDWLVGHCDRIVLSRCSDSGTRQQEPGEEHANISSLLQAVKMTMWLK